MSDHCNSQTLCWSASRLPNNELYWRYVPFEHFDLKSLDKIVQEGPQDSSSGTIMDYVLTHALLVNVLCMCVTYHLLTSLCSAPWVLQPAVLGLRGARGQTSLPVQHGRRMSKRGKRILGNMLNLQGWHYVINSVRCPGFDSWWLLSFRFPPSLPHNDIISNWGKMFKAYIPTHLCFNTCGYTVKQ